MEGIPSKLRWACRRGMLELDILLGKFLEHKYLQLSNNEKEVFEKLLTCNDQELFDWFRGEDKPIDKELLKMVEAIREFNRSYH